MKKNPFCSIIVLNYFGEKVIERNLESLQNLTYPKNRYEILVVDNNSIDNSRDVLNRYREKHKNVKVFFLEKNLGFSKGNNVGIKQAKGEYVVLLNNDSVVEKNWLSELVKVAQSDKKIFAVNSKVYLYPKYYNLLFELNHSLIPLYIWISKTKINQLKDEEKILLNLKKESGGYRVEVFFDPYFDQEIELTILFNSKNRNKKYIRDLIRFKDSSVRIGKVTVTNDDIEIRVLVDIKKLNKRKMINKIQNAGIIVFQDGSGRDIGAIITHNLQHYEYDSGQYNKEREVYAACGVAVLYKKQILKKLGYLDESYFMYYEDVDISENARFLGYKSYYSPKAIVRHFHAFSSKEWSPFFVYNAFKGQLLHIFYNFPLRIFIHEYFMTAVRLGLASITLIIRVREILLRIKHKNIIKKENKFVKSFVIAKVLLFFLLFFGRIMIIRIKKQSKRGSGAVEENYKKILAGEWYFK